MATTENKGLHVLPLSCEASNQTLGHRIAKHPQRKALSAVLFKHQLTDPYDFRVLL